MPQRPVLLTSIPPSVTRFRAGREIGPAYQRECVDSWIEAGFDVITVNPESEASVIREFDLPIDIRTVSYSGPPNISDLLGADTGPHPIGGIVNADCKLISQPGLADRLSSLAAGKMLLFERLDIMEDGVSILPQTAGGFDMFLFDRTSINVEQMARTQSPFSIGDPWWDYWFPCDALIKGVPVTRLVWPIVFHLDHNRNWSQEKYNIKANTFRQWLFSNYQSEDTPDWFKDFAGELHRRFMEGHDVLDKSIHDLLWDSERCSLTYFHEDDTQSIERHFGYLHGYHRQRYWQDLALQRKLKEKKDQVERQDFLFGNLKRRVREMNHERIRRRRAKKRISQISRLDMEH